MRQAPVTVPAGPGPAAGSRDPAVDAAVPVRHIPGDCAPLLEFGNVTVFCGSRKVLDRVSMTVREREHLAILGPNGSGKSTFIRTVLREQYPVANPETVFRFRGEEIWDVFALRSAIGVVSNELQFRFTRPVTGRDVILSGFFSGIGLFNQEITPAMEEKADEILRFLEISHLRNRPMNTLSSGEARRLLIGRALVHDPATLLLDEPTNSLDLHALHTFRNTLRKVARSGTGIILVTHQLHDIIPEISRVVLIRDGVFCADGRKEEILTATRIGGLFRVPVRIRREDEYYYATGY